MEVIQTIIFRESTRKLSIRSSIQDFEVLRERINAGLHRHMIAVRTIDTSGVYKMTSEARPGVI
jgi:hypothetical protein